MKHVVNFFKGIALGISMLIGVSGGTMAIILNVYDKLLHSINSFFKDIKNNLIFLLTLGAGGAAGFFLFSNIIKKGLENFRFPMVFLFLGIIIGGLPLLYKKAEFAKIKAKDILPFAAGLVIVVAMSLSKSTVVNLAESTGALNVIFMFIAGILMAIALILPGISGMFFLLSIGLYDITLAAVTEINLAYLIPFAAGTGLGIILTARVLENLMEKKKRATYLVILGFVIGSVIVLFMENIPCGADIIYSAVALPIGYAITYVITKFGSRLQA